ncbi:Translin [Geranomyces variabilis]|nr:Translin [Geranomyces variabilis]KAJ3134584.1 hypothetical protein HDU90_004916 [Geranomyces variabilis]
MSLFTELGVALDDMHDRRERVVKTSRDITIGSKRVISLLHRVAGAGGEARADLLIQARQKIGEVATLFRVVGPDLRGNDFDKHHRSIAPGLEEFIEAVSFQRFIEKGDLISRCDIQRLLVDDDDDNNESHGTTDIITIPDEDYILGLADLTGELMRLAINSVAKGEIALVDDICRFLRDLTNDYEVVNFPPARKKMSTMRASLAKVEKACYAIKVRSAEYPPEKIAEMLAMGFGTGEDPRDGEESPRGESSWNDS